MLVPAAFLLTMRKLYYSSYLALFEHELLDWPSVTRPLPPSWRGFSVRTWQCRADLSEDPDSVVDDVSLPPISNNLTWPNQGIFAVSA